MELIKKIVKLDIGGDGELNDKSFSFTSYTPTTIREMNNKKTESDEEENKIMKKNEDFFEKILSKNLGLLQLESLKTNIRGTFECFNQVNLQRSLGNNICPDIVIFSESGHVIIVEVKLFDNPELKNRKVISQIVDYAASFSTLDEKKLVEMFSNESEQDDSFLDLVKKWFPKYSKDYGELKNEYLRKIDQGDINLIIACDRVPDGVTDLVKSMSKQSAVGFNLSLVEVIPFVNKNDKSQVVFVPTNRLKTEIVGRTTVTIIQEVDNIKVEVKTTGIDEIEKNIEDSKKGLVKMTPEEIEADIQNDGTEFEKKLLEFCKKESFKNQFTSPGKKKNSTFGFYVKSPESKNSESQMIMICVKGRDTITFYQNAVDKYDYENLSNDFSRKLKEIFCDDINIENKEPNLSKDLLSEKFEELKNFLIWFEKKVS